MNEPLPGQKTNLLAGVYVLLQTAKAAGFIEEPTAQVLEQLIALGMTITLALKARRSQER